MEGVEKKKGPGFFPSEIEPPPENHSPEHE